MATTSWFSVFFLCSIVQLVTGRAHIVVVVPNVVQVGVPQNVAVTVTHDSPITVPVDVSVEDELGDGLYRAPQLSVGSGKPELVNILVPFDKVPAPHPSGTRYVFVRSQSSDNRLSSFNQRVRCVLTMKSMSVFIQTDKPIYIRDEDVHIRVIAVDSDLKVVKGQNVVIDIKNPQDIIVDRFNFTMQKAALPAIEKFSLSLGPAPVEGDWKLIAKYGYQGSIESKYSFEVKDYVLPRFDVKVRGPGYVRSNDSSIKISVSSLYTFGKGVVGRVMLKLGIWNELNQTAKTFIREKFSLEAEDEGNLVLYFPSFVSGLFPEGERLWISADVTEGASGIHRNTSDMSTMFTDTPVQLDCDLSSKLFRPGLSLEVSVRAKYVNGTMASGILLSYNGNGTTEQTATTDEHGIARVSVSVPKTLTGSNYVVLVRDQHSRLGKQCLFQRYTLPTSCEKPFVIRISGTSLPKIGQQMKLDITKAADFPSTVDLNIVFLSRGRILKVLSKEKSSSATETVSVSVTPEFAGKFCIVAFYISQCGGYSVVADSICTDTQKVFRNKISLSGKTGRLTPGGQTSITIQASKFSDIALLAVDKGLEILNNENKLSRETVFDDMSIYDKSCGFQGTQTQDIFKAAGLTTVSNANLSQSIRSSETCSQRSRRSVGEELGQACWCSLGSNFRRAHSIDESNPTDVDRLIMMCNSEAKKLRESLDRGIKQEFACDLIETGPKYYRACCLPPILRQRSSFSMADNIEFDMNVPVRTNFPHVWLWDKKINMGNYESQPVAVTIPDSITNWVVYGLALSEEDGFGVADPLTLNVFNPVHIDCHLPFSLVRQEQASLACTAFNFNNQKTRACVSLSVPSSSANSICTAGGIGRETIPYCFNMNAKGAETITFPVVPMRAGKSKVRVVIGTAFGGDGVEREITVEPEGVPTFKDFSASLDPEGVNTAGDVFCKTSIIWNPRPGTCYKRVSRNGTCSDRLRENVTEEQCCVDMIGKFSVAWKSERGSTCQPCPRRSEHYNCADEVARITRKNAVQVNKFYVRVPESYVPGTALAYLSVTGQYILSNVQPVDGVSSLLRGFNNGDCGEQTMMKFAPNVAIVRHLKDLNQLTPTQERNYLPKVQDGYRQILKYLKRDGANLGGFSVWTYSEPSSWLTAFALQTICAARDIATVDDNVIVSTTAFLCGAPAKDSSGAFYTKYISRHHDEMIGGVRDGDSSLTAYVTLSLLECYDYAKDLFNTATTDCICSAVEYLSYSLNDSARPYAKVLTYLALRKACNTHNLCKCDSVAVSRAYGYVRQLERTEPDGSKYLQATTSSTSWGQTANAVTVEVTSYGICAHIASGSIQEARPLAKWLNNNRNFKGGFYSTQETVVALNCLTKFSNTLEQTRTLKVNVSSKTNTSFHHSFTVDDHNRDVSQHIELPINNEITVETSGNGLGLIQIGLQYNEDLADEDACAFDMEVNASSSETEHKVDEFGIAKYLKTIIIKTCARYRSPLSSPMAVMEIDLPTGYEACNDSESQDDEYCLPNVFRQLKSNDSLTEFRVSGRSVVLYFDEIDNVGKTCVEFRVLEKFPILFHVPVKARVYLYYEPDKQCTKFYGVDGGASELAVLCKQNPQDQSCVCAAGRCPVLERIANRSCKACDGYRYAYKVEILHAVKMNGWRRFKSRILKVIKDGEHELKKDEQIKFWMAESCTSQIDISEGKSYHIIGKDAIKFILDHNALIEKLPQPSKDCLKRKRSKCSNTCKKIDGKAKRARCLRKCPKQVNRDCADKVEFELYEKLMSTGRVCDANVC